MSVILGRLPYSGHVLRLPRKLSAISATTCTRTADPALMIALIKKDDLGLGPPCFSGYVSARFCATSSSNSKTPGLIKLAGAKWRMQTDILSSISDTKTKCVQSVVLQQRLCKLSTTCTRRQEKEPTPTKSTKEQQIVEMKDKPFSELTTAQKVKQTTEDVTYTGVIIVGVGVTAAMFYFIGRELFSKQSPSGVFGQALKLCQKNHQIQDCLGEPIKGYGETTRRGRRRYVSHAEWFDDQGIKHMRMKFYVAGPQRKGTAHLEVKQNDQGKYEYRYLFVELDGYPMRTIILEDNR